FFIISTVILAFFFALGRGHMINTQDVLPWIGAAFVSCFFTYFWAKRNSKELRERQNLWGPDSPTHNPSVRKRD
ncbi:MAG: hypothetical protein ACTHU4_10875, partial [Corynebacterium casei]